MNREQRRMHERAQRQAGKRSRRIAALGSGAVLAVSAGGAAATLAASTASAAVNDTVTNLNDSGSGSLRDAIEDANANGGGTITFESTLTGTIPLASDLPEIEESVTITGPGASAVTIDGNDHRVFYLDSVHTLTISGLTLVDGGYAPLQVFGDGTIVADQMTITDNSPDTNRGGGLNCNGGNLTLTNSNVSGNVANDGGGGLYLYGCDTTIVSTTIADNQAVDGEDGGGLYIESGTTNIENSTISGNYANDNSAAVYIDGGEGGPAEVTISNSTIANNTAANSDDPAVAISVASGSSLDLIQSTITGNHHVGDAQERYIGALYLQDGTDVASSSGNDGPRPQGQHGHGTAEGDVQAAAAGPVNIVGTIITGNGDTSTGSDNFDIFTAEEEVGMVSSDHSIIGATSENVTVDDQGGTLRDVDPMLGELTNNGGPTETMALLTGSPAIDAGPVPVPDFPLNENDQRGEGFPRVVNGTVDIGAFEVQPPPAPPAPPAPAPEVVIQPRFTG